MLRTQGDDGEWLETRLWIVDHEGFPWLHGANSQWMHNLRERPLVELERAGETGSYHAHPVPGPHPEIDALMREKYGVADVWVRFIVPDDEVTMPVRLEPVESAGG